MSYTPIDIEEMRSKLLTLDAFKAEIAATEGLSQYTFETDHSNSVQFHFPDDWNVGFDRNTDPFTLTTATVTLDGRTMPLTKEAACEAGSKIGIQKTYMLSTPGSLITPHLNWHYKNGANGQKEVKILAGENAVAFTRGTVKPFSNHSLLDSVVEAINDKYNTDEILVDYKRSHTLDKTSARLIIPSHSRSIGSARAANSGDDPWSVGIELTNSLTGMHPLELSGYLFAWWCTNGCTFNHVSSGKYRRKPTLDADDAYEWARSVVDDVLDGLEEEFEAVEALTMVNLEGELAPTTNALFERFKIPVDARDAIMDNLVESADLTAYGLLNSITSVANDESLSPGNVSALLNAGGQVAHVLSERCEVCHKF